MALYKMSFLYYQKLSVPNQLKSKKLHQNWMKNKNVYNLQFPLFMSKTGLSWEIH